MNNICIILVEPQMSENIGFIARIMSNFGMSDMRVINPRCEVYNSPSSATAAHGREVLCRAKTFEHLPEALSDINTLIATSVRKRDLNIKQVELKDMMPHVTARHLATEKIGVMFGRESSGLTNDEIRLANFAVSIPTSDYNPSMNISHSAAIICQALYENAASIEEKTAKSNCDVLNGFVTKGDVMALELRLFNLLEEKGFFTDKKNCIIKKRISAMLNKMHVSRSEINMLHGMISAVEGKDV